jgi:hypothetical protein
MGEKHFLLFPHVNGDSEVTARVKGVAIAESEASLDTGKQLRSYRKSASFASIRIVTVARLKVFLN